MTRLIHILSAICLIVSFNVHASHLNGGEMTYRCLGSNTYEITLDLYWECSATFLADSQLVSVSSSSLGVSNNVYLYLTDTMEITKTCTAVTTVCSNLGSAYPGTIKNTFKDTIVLSGVSNDWLVEYSNCCRLPSITNINNPQSQNTYLNVVIDNNICNNSPSFLQDPDIINCRIVQNCLNLKAFDVDGDSLVYKVVPSLTALNTPISYTPGHSTSSPIAANSASNFSIDSLTGLVCFTSNNLVVSNMAVEVEEYRNGQKIGFIRRDMVYFIINCVNASPVLSGVDTSYSNFSNVDTAVCANSQVNLTIGVSDPDPDNIGVIWDGGIQGANFNVNYSGNSALVDISFTAPANDTTLSFTLTVSDSVCPYVGHTSKSYFVHVSGITVDAGSPNVCSGGTVQLGGSPTAVGGVVPYSYLWTPSWSLTNVNTANPITSGCDTMYTVSVTDANGCTGTDSIYVSCATSLQADAGADDTICPGTFVLGGLNPAIGGTPPYNFAWSPASLLNDATIGNPIGFACDTTYVLSVTDDNGCVDVDSIYIECYNIQADAGPDACVSIGGCVQIGPFNTLPNTTYTWSPDIDLNDDSIANPISCPSDTIVYTLTVQDTLHGCFDVDSIEVCTVPLDSVWPGDANSDGVADIVDVLNIGVAYNSAGLTRPNASVNWLPQAAGDWSGQFLSGLNQKHADCNGDGLVDLNDLNAVLLNYGLTHNKTDDLASATDPVLFFDWPNFDTVGENQSLIIPIHLGTNTLPADSIYGLAFSILYNNDLVDTSNMTLSYTTSWIGSPSTRIDVDTNFTAQGKIDIAITKTDQIASAGNGQIGALEIVTADDLTGASEIVVDTLSLEIVVHSANNESGYPLQVGTNNKSIIILEGGENDQLNKPFISVYPNPSKGQINIQSSDFITSLEIVNALGQIEYQSQLMSKNVVLNSSLPAGIYFLKIVGQDKDQPIVKRIEILD
ncbi:MAG: T9SS type A sorting domain-containing protein [Flavobacteriales bacterium]|nr:T9SS type A sorting domain-containing protein [Flavobacteriales bacterium]